MRDILGTLTDWYSGDVRFALATVVETFRSAPRQPGAAMAVSELGEVVGSISGGCVEGAVYELAKSVLDDGLPVLTRYGVSDDDAFEVGLTCGGMLDVFVQPIDAATAPGFGDVAASIRNSVPVALATIVAGTHPVGTQLAVYDDRTAGALGSPRLDEAVARSARSMLGYGRNGVVHIGRSGEQRADELGIFVQSFARPPRMLVFGAIDFAGAVVHMGKYLGYAVTLCDARPVFATAKRFPEADEVVVRWPHQYLTDVDVDERTVICVLTHDPKFDVPLLEVALQTPAAYIGVMGSRRTNEARLAQLRERGVTEDQLARLSSPIGLDLGARSPEETAVSIAAEIIAVHTGNVTGRRLRELSTAIHP